MFEWIEQKGMTVDHDFGYFLSLFSYFLKKEGRRKGEGINKNRHKRSCLSTRSFEGTNFEK